MKRMSEFVSGEPRTPTLDLRLAFSWARRDFSRARENDIYSHICSQSSFWTLQILTSLIIPLRFDDDDGVKLWTDIPN